MIEKFFRNLKLYLEFSSFERRGVIALLFTLILVCVYVYISKSITSYDVIVDQAKLNKFKSQIQENIAAAEDDKPKYENYNKSSNYNQEEKRLSGFNPNSDDFKTLLRKGVPYKVVQNIVNYREKGGSFKSKNDLAKLYSLDEDTYSRLEAYILLPDALPVDTARHLEKKWKQDPVSPVVINSATETELVKINGIGPSFAKRLIERREQLGGYVKPEQLGEVYGLTQETIDKIVPFLIFSQQGLRKLNINAESYEELATHPYLSYREAKAIINYRQQHGDFANIKDISKLHIFRGKDVDRILPYLDLN